MRSLFGFVGVCALVVFPIMGCNGDAGGAGGTGGTGGTDDTVAAVTAGIFHTCARWTSGSVQCWGAGANGALGYGNENDVGDDETPASAGLVNVGAEVSQISAGGSHTCALLASTEVKCWGEGTYGTLGYGNTDHIGNDEAPSSVGVVDVGGSVAEVSAGGSHTCARLTDGNVRCWGLGVSGQLGYAATDTIGDDEVPSARGDVDVGAAVAQIATGGSHTCVLLSTGKVRCWGEGLEGRLGYGNTTSIGDDEAPASVGDVDVGGEVAQIAAGVRHTCAVLTTAKVRCWGAGSAGQLGYGTTDDIGDTETPASAGDVDVGADVSQVVAGNSFSCALRTDGGVTCWGDAAYGALGYAGTENIGDDETPASAGTVNVGGEVVELSARESHVCALLTTGSIRCWGRNNLGQLGYGNTEDIGDGEEPASAGDVPVS